jgi:hypothetical protein
MHLVLEFVPSTFRKANYVPDARSSVLKARKLNHKPEVVKAVAQ